MAQTLLIGLGGTGSRVVNNVARDLRENGVALNDGNLCCAVLDTDRGDVDKINASGTDIPVIPISKDRPVQDYLAMYPEARTWFPCSHSVMQRNMLKGAGQMRFCSRLAFMDIVQDNTIMQLENHINMLFNNRRLNDPGVRVMIVSSLAGGTGSGMFIQVALWLRRFFANKCFITIRGIFILPDVFVRHGASIRESKDEQKALYANAYAAIRDLNALTRVRLLGEKPAIPLAVDNLFDSDWDMPATPVYDYVFLVDAEAKNGATLGSIDEYENLIARMVYMQLYAPMADAQESKEDNLFRLFTNLREPVYGTCGTARASYPVKSVLSYCAQRAAQDSLSTGWQRLDAEIKREQDREKAREARGEMIADKLNPRERYITLFDGKRAVDPKVAGKDKLFLTIGRDVDTDGKTNSSKVDVFIKRLLALIEAAVADKKCAFSPAAVELTAEWAKKYNADENQSAASDEELPTIDEMIELVASKRNAVANFLRNVDNKTQVTAYDLLSLVCPLDMDDVNYSNEASIYGMFTKINENGEREFVHPIAIRYMLYKLAIELKKLRVSADDLKTMREAAESGYGEGSGVERVDFDNPRTHGANKVEVTPEQYLASRAPLQTETGFLKRFAGKYAQYMQGQYNLCTNYAKETLLQLMIPVLLQYLETLTKKMESFFASLPEVSKELSSQIDLNKQATEQAKSSAVEEQGLKTYFVCGSPENKEAMYLSLGLDSEIGGAHINHVVAQTIYGMFCVAESPTSAANAAYADISLKDMFLSEITDHYTRLIWDDPDRRSKVDLDLYTAICRAEDFKLQAQGTSEVARTASQKTYTDAFLKCKAQLISIGSPMLSSRDIQPIDNTATSVYGNSSATGGTRLPVKKTISFWGYNPALSAACKNIDGLLEISKADGESTAYAKGDLYYYIAEYGILPKYIPKLAEPLDSDLKSGAPSDGLFYNKYCEKINDMLTKISDPLWDAETALLDTPHLDKTWHAFLPYISAEKQREESGKFLRLFWLAVAYGMITIKRNIELNNREYFYIARTAKNAIRTYAEPQMARFNGDPIVATNVYALVESLRTDAIFLHDAAALEATLADELAKLSNYEDTKLLRGDAGVGGLAAASEMNAATMIIRYANAPQSRATAVDELAAAVEELLKEMIAMKYAEGRTKSVDSVMRGLCNRIYVASPMKKDDLPCFANWVRASKETNVEKENEE